MPSTPLTAAQRASFRRSALSLAAVLALLCLAILGNRPSRKSLRFDAACGSFIAPIPLTLKLQYGETEVQRLNAHGFSGAVGNAAVIDFGPHSGPRRRLTAVGLSLNAPADPNQTPPHLEALPSGAFGKSELKLKAGARLTAAAASAGAAPVLSIEAAPGIASLALVAGTLALHGNRYLLPEAAPTDSLLPDFTVTVEGALPGALLRLNSISPTASAKVSFKPSTSELTLLPPPQPGTDPWRLAPDSRGAPPALVLRGCVNPDLRLGDKTAAGIIPDRAVDLDIQALSGTLDSIALLPNAAVALRIKGTVETHSLQQDGQELLPTHLAEIMEQPYTQRNLVLVLLGILAFVALKVADRALSVILEYLLPKE